MFVFQVNNHIKNILVSTTLLCCHSFTQHLKRHFAIEDVNWWVPVVILPISLCMDVNGKDVVLKAACLFENLIVLFCINAVFTEVELNFSRGTEATPYHHRAWLLDLLVLTLLTVLFIFVPQHTGSHFLPKKI